MQIVQARSGYEFAVGSPDGSRCAAVEKKIHAQDVLRLHSGRFRDLTAEGSGCLATAKDRGHIGLRVPGITFIYFAVHVNRHLRNHQQIPIDIYQLAADSEFRANDRSVRQRKEGDPPRNRKCRRHTALHLIGCSRQGSPTRLLLLPGMWASRCARLRAESRSLHPLECGTRSARRNFWLHNIRPARDSPGASLPESGKPGSLQCLPGRLCRMKCCRASLYKLNQFFTCIHAVTFLYRQSLFFHSIKLLYRQLLFIRWLYQLS